MDHTVVRSGVISLMVLQVDQAYCSLLGTLIYLILTLKIGHTLPKFSGFVHVICCKLLDPVILVAWDNSYLNNLTPST